MEFLRQMEIFSPEKHKNRRIDIIGAGATGSYVSWLLAKVGFENLCIWDDDVVEAHNLPSQFFFKTDQGRPKVEAIADLLGRGAGVSPVTHRKKFYGEGGLGEIVFLLTDTMESRKQIWKGALKYKLSTRLVIETRMGGDSGRVYSVNPSKRSHVEGWESASNYSDKEAAKSLCGASVSIATTAALIACVAVWQLQKWCLGQLVESELLVQVNPWQIISRNF